MQKWLNAPDSDDISPRHHTWERNDKHEDRPLDDVFLQEAQSTLKTKRPLTLTAKVNNTNRSVGTKLSGEIAYRYGDEGLPEGTLDIQISGSAGQSLGAFLVKGVHLTLTGEANDYVGKGMSGGEIVLKPMQESQFDASINAIAGNTVLYGATGGWLFVCGTVGERFAVRNSGAKTVVEGIGDHGCEYMTNGTVVVLGPTGKNFGAGMSGGIAYIYDAEDTFPKKINPAMITIARLSANEEIELVQSLVQRHRDLTESQKAQSLLADWSLAQTRFWKVVPKPSTPPVDAAVVKVEAKV